MDFSLDREKGKRAKDIRTLVFLQVFLHLCLMIQQAECKGGDETGDGGTTTYNSQDPVWNIRHILPTLNLENNSVTDVFYNVGDNAFLPCRFPQYSRHHEGSVSWIRRWDWQILSAGVYSNTNDDRFAVLHREGSEDWTLQIKYIKMSDNGTYDCQVHSGASFLSHFVNLHIVQPKAKIVGASEIHVSSGESFTLTCKIEKMISPPVYVMWLHKNTPLNYAPDRPRLTVATIPKGVHTSSTVNVVMARDEDSGNYTCTAPNAEAASVMVYVTEGDAVAAIQRIETVHPSAGSSKLSHSYKMILLNIIFILLMNTDTINNNINVKNR